ncbi:MAG: Flp family type IVb pilin [Rhodospirillaceae bacterium]
MMAFMSKKFFAVTAALRGRHGATAIEYGMIAAAMAVAVGAAMLALRPVVSNFFGVLVGL